MLNITSQPANSIPPTTDITPSGRTNNVTYIPYIGKGRMTNTPEQWPTETLHHTVIILAIEDWVTSESYTVVILCITASIPEIIH